MAEDSVAKITLDLEINNDTAEQLDKILNQTKQSVQKIGINIQSAIEAPIKEASENVQNTLGTAFETVSETAQKNIEKSTKSYEELAQKAWERYKPPKKINENIKSTIETPIKEVAENTENTLGTAFEKTFETAEKAAKKTCASVDEEAQKILKNIELLQEYYKDNPAELEKIQKDIASGNVQKYANYDTSALEAINQSGNKISEQFQGIFDKLKDFKIPTTPVERLRAELENTRAKSDLLKAEWEELKKAEPSEKVTAKMLSLQQQIIATDKASERLENDLKKSENLDNGILNGEYTPPEKPFERLQRQFELTNQKIESVARTWQQLKIDLKNTDDAQSAIKIRDKLAQTENQLISLSNTADKYKQKIDAMSSETASAVNAQIQETFNKLKDFQIPTTPVERLRAELENTRAKSDLLKAEWEELKKAEPSEKVTAKMLSLQQQIIATDKAAERLESDLNKDVGSETASAVNAQFQSIFDRMKNFKIPATPAEHLQTELENTRTKIALLQRQWQELSAAEPTEKVVSQMLRIQQQIVSTQTSAERLRNRLTEFNHIDMSYTDKQISQIFSKFANFKIPSSPIDYFQKKLENTRTKTELLQKKLQILSMAEPSKKISEQMLKVQQQIDNARKKAEKLENKIAEFNVSRLKQELNEFISVITLGLKGLGNTVLAPIQAVVSAIKNIGNACHTVYEKIKYYLENPLLAVRDAGKTTFSAIKKAGSKAFSIIKSAGNSAFGVLKSVGGKALDSLKNRFGFLNKSALSLSKPIKKLGTTLKNTFRRVFVMATLYAAVKAIKNSFSEILKSNDELSKSLNDVKANLSIAFTPVIQAVMPALNTMMSGLARATKYIAGFISRLFGMTYRQAAEATKKLHDTGRQATDTAKKATMSMAGIDEMNILSDSSDDSKNEEDTGIDYSNLDMSEPELPDWAERLKKAIKSGDWYGVGEVLSERVNAVFGSINWENIEKKVTVGVNKICDLVNGFVDNINFRYLGNTLAGGINTITSAVNAFSDNIHWEKIGSGLADGLNQAVNKIKWKQLGRSMSSNIRILTNLLYGFVTEFDWKKLGKGIGEAVNSWFDGIDFGKLGTTLSEGIKGIFSTTTSMLQTVDFGSIGGKIAEFVNNIDVAGILSGLASSVSSLITGLFDFLINFVEQTDWLSLGEQIKNGLGEAIQNIDWNGIITKASELLGSVVGGASALIAPILMKAWEALKKAWNSVKDYFNKKIKECGGNVIEGVFKGISDSLKTVGNWIKEHIFKPFMNGFKKAFGIHSPSKEMATMGEYIIAGLFNSVSDGIAKIREIFDKMLKTIKKVFFGIGNWFRDKFSEARDNITKIFCNIGNWFSDRWDDITRVFSATGSWFSERFTNARNNITEIFCNIGNWFSDRWNDITDVFSAVGSWFGERFTNAWDNIKNSFSEVKGFFEEVWNGITNVFSHVTNWFRDTFSEAWEAVKNVFSKGGEIFTGITDGIFETFKSVVNNLIDGINSVITEPFNTINWALDNIRGIQLMDWYPFEWLPSINVPQIPKLADGGLATAPTLAMVGDNKNAKTDPEVIAPLSKLEGMLGNNSEITELLKIIVELLKNGMNIEIINYLFRNSQEFSRQVVKAVAEDNARKGGK